MFIKRVDLLKTERIKRSKEKRERKLK